MCGRFALFSHPEALAFDLEAEGGFDFPPPRFNIAPGSPILALRSAPDGRRSFANLHWGLIPSWAKDRRFGYRTINARAETLAEKPSFRDAFMKRRCLIPADGFYEWETTDSGKQPYFIRRAEAGLLAFAGLWGRWTDRETGEVVESATIVVTRANDLVGRIHDRMPVILDPDDFGIWLDPRSAPGPTLKGLLRPMASESLDMHPVDPRVGRSTHDDPGLIQPIEGR
ncbi:SOS response-associated peptidase [Imhoffiella purpurea]|uniref:Abasic site processing protein n=1 Tax=Imhoffiella purpurea TaxID=1249627 RepID=W9VEH0_9GAMM|nr:SOS response-associated peptidase [Imhoffiella purpurea]EXJ15371.1 hypothetical protein D779_1467 [Imhoffiella purpurea]